MDTIRTFRDLVAWKLGKKTITSPYVHTQQMPDPERFGLTSQKRRAATSIPSNIEEGYGLGSTAGFLRHLRIARGSTFELGTQLEIATDLGFLAHNPELMSTREKTARALQGMIRSLEQELNSETPDH